MPSSELTNARSAVASAISANRRAKRALTAFLDSQEGEYFGRFELAPGEEVDPDELAAFVQLAQGSHPHQTLDITVTARQGTDERSRNGHHDEPRREAPKGPRREEVAAP